MIKPSNLWVPASEVFGGSRFARLWSGIGSRARRGWSFGRLKWRFRVALGDLIEEMISNF